MCNSVCLNVTKCLIGLSCKSSTLPQDGCIVSSENINFPFLLESANLIGPYPRSKNGNQYLLVY